MVSIERASKSEQTLLKHYSLKINLLRDTEGKELSSQGVVSVLDIRYDYKKYSPNYFTINFFILFQYFTFFNNKIEYLRY